MIDKLIIVYHMIGYDMMICYDMTVYNAYR